MKKTHLRHLQSISLAAALLLTACDPISLPTRDDAPLSEEAKQHYKMGLNYTNGTGVAQNYRKAADLFEDAALSGHSDAQYMLGIAHSTGRGVGVNQRKAVHWFEKAAAKGQKRAQYQLGESYMNGRGAEKDTAWGAHWYGMAANQGHTLAQRSLGVAFIKGLGVPKNPKTATTWLRLADKSGDGLAGKLLQKMQQTVDSESYGAAITRAEAWRARKMAGYDNRPTIRYLQYTLSKLGYRPGYADGILGPKTKDAVGHFLDKNGHANDLTLEEVIELMREESPEL
ncbi:MAG: SEL1-like repeat protein [Candidatus Sedimenticola sp. (ex Thyasira tokunagai)]